MKTLSNDPVNIVESNHNISNGVTKREYFAAMAMQGLLTNYVSHGLYGNHESQPNVHVQAIMCADQLIEELNK